MARIENVTITNMCMVFEETGLKISCPQLRGIKDWIQKDGTRYMVIFYKTDKLKVQ